MAPSASSQPLTPKKKSLGPFRRAVLHGLGVLLPPLLTVAIFLWAGNTIITYLLEPVEQTAQSVMIWSAEASGNILPESQVDESEKGPLGTAVIDEETFLLTADDYYIPTKVYTKVKGSSPASAFPSGAYDIYERYLKLTYLRRQVLIPVFLGVFILVLYLIGKFLAAGVGRFLWIQVEKLIVSVPLVRQVYSSVKQVTDFMFKEPEIRATRVVAIEYPRKGIWSLAMVTGEGLLDISAAANEPMLSVLIPTSPMPFTGFTIMIKKSEAVDLNITMDQALQFIMSCGVVVPPHQAPSLLVPRSERMKEIGVLNPGDEGTNHQ